MILNPDLNIGFLDEAASSFLIQVQRLEMAAINEMHNLSEASETKKNFIDRLDDLISSTVDSVVIFIEKMMQKAREYFKIDEELIKKAKAHPDLKEIRVEVHEKVADGTARKTIATRIALLDFNNMLRREKKVEFSFEVLGPKSSYGIDDGKKILSQFEALIKDKDLIGNLKKDIEYIKNYDLEEAKDNNDIAQIKKKFSEIIRASKIIIKSYFVALSECRGILKKMMKTGSE